MPTTPTSPTLAEQFHTFYKDYFFQDAHFQVEAAASVEAKEISRNVFEFPDESILRLGANAPIVQTYKDLVQLVAQLRTEVPDEVILPQDC